MTEADFCISEPTPARARDESTDDSPVLLSGAYERRGELSDRLLRMLPHVLRVPSSPGGQAVAPLLAAEIAQQRPGQQVVLDRILDWLLVTALRAWFDDPDTDAPQWCRALNDSVVGTALRLLHDDPAHRWTVASLAAKSGVSRATLARRFTSMVGESPMAYLASWRVDRAADLLRHTDYTMDAVARRVGYANAFALSVAFKRINGTRPGELRRDRPATPAPGDVAGPADDPPARAV